MPIKKKVKKAIKRLQSGTAKALSAPSRIRSARKGARADAMRKTIVKARRFDNAPDFKNGLPTEAQKTRASARAIKRKIKKRPLNTKRGTITFKRKR